MGDCIWLREDLRQADYDKWIQRLPACGCCGHRIYPGGQFYKLDVGKNALIVCEECASEMMGNPCIAEDVSYGN